MSDRLLKKHIADLKVIEKANFGSRQRFAFYGYLAEVLGFYQLLRRNRMAKVSANRIAELFGIRRQKRTHSIRVIIDATSVADEKTKSRWSRALRYAWRRHGEWKMLAEFLESNGGPAGCAAKLVALHKRGNSRLKIGGATIVPNIAPLVVAPLFKPDQLFVNDGRVYSRPDVSEASGSNAGLTKEGAAVEMPQRKGA